MGDKIETVDAKEATKKLIAAHKTIHEYQLLENLAPINQENPGKMNKLILEALKRAKSISASDLSLALEIRKEAQNFFESLFFFNVLSINPSPPITITRFFLLGLCLFNFCIIFDCIFFYFYHTSTVF